MSCNPFLQEKKRERTFAKIWIYNEETGKEIYYERRVIWRYGMWGVNLNGAFESIHWLKKRNGIKIELFTI
jgi:hypothetical protein